MEVWVSNQVGATFRAAGNAFEVWFGDGSGHSEMFSRKALEDLLAGANDIAHHSVESPAAAKKLADAAWRKDRALRLMLMLLDPSEPDDELPELAECLDNLMSHADAWRHCVNQLAAQPIPEPNRLGECLQQLASFERLHTRLREIESLQDAIALAHDALHRLPDDVFEGEKAEFVERAIDEGAFYELAKSWGSQASRQFAAMSIGARLRGATPQAQQIVLAWAALDAPSKRKRTLAEREEESEGSRYFRNPTDGRSGYEKFTSVLAQQRVIVERLRSGDLNGARAFMDQLVAQQVAEGEEFAVKSLCSMAQEAKHLGIFGLHLEWSSWAVKLRPEDAWAQGQMADALTSFGRFGEARAALSAAEATYPAFVANNLARIMRLTGNLDGALKAYCASRDEFGDDPDAHYAWIGIAEVHRELGNLDAALAVYDEASEIFPNHSAVLSGRAAVLADMGNFHAALQSLSRSLAANRGDIVALNGIASVRRSQGDLDGALQQYNEVLSRFPDEPYSISGRADVLRLTGDHASALADYERLIAEYPFLEFGYVGKGRILTERGQYQSALELYSDALLRFPDSQRITFSFASLKAREGDWHAALALFDKLTVASPKNLRAQLGKIRVLNRMQQAERALEAVDKLLQLAPRHRQALNEKAAALFALKRYEAVLEVTVTAEVRTEAEWAGTFIRAMSMNELGRAQEAETMLRRGLRAPINRVRRYTASGLAILKLKANHLNAAREIVQSAPGEASALVRLHIAAASRQTSALADYEAGAAGEIASYSEVKEEIVRRFRVIEGGAEPVQSRNWIFEAETRLLILDAAADDFMLLAA